MGDLVLRGVSSLLAVVVCAAAAADPPVKFVEVSGARGILSYTTAFGMGGGLAAADFDADGDVDFFVPTAAGVPDQLYRNLGNGQFEEIAAQAGLASPGRHRVALWFDYDGDGALDLFVAGDCYQIDEACTATSTLTLYRQVADAQFEDVTLATGFSDDLISDIEAHRGGMCAGDINNDGYLDLAIGLWQGDARLFLNEGDGTFADIGVSSGIGGTYLAYWQPMMYDFNDDGLLDIYFAVDFTENRFMINQGDYTFVDRAAEAALDNAMNDMGMSLGDYDNDGDPDIFITNVAKSVDFHNVLFRNDSVDDSLLFEDQSIALDLWNGHWGWGITFLDADNDGWLDIAATNGFFADLPAFDPSLFYLNDGGNPVTFTDLSDEVGFNDTFWGSALIGLDYERDGDVDLLQTCNGSGSQPAAVRLLENRPSGTAPVQNHLVVRPRMSGANRRAIGAVVRILIGQEEQMRVVTAGTSFMGQEPAEAFFGVGSATMVDRLTVEWPGATPPTELTNVAVNQVLDVAVDTDTDGDGTPDASDTDDDNDGLIDENDCFPTNGQVWDTPGEVTDLELTQASGQTTLTWVAPLDPGGTWLPYDTLVSDFASGFDTAASCIESHDGTDTKAIDTIDPAAGEVKHYLVRIASPCGDGSAGSDSSGVLRAVVECH